MPARTCRLSGRLRDNSDRASRPQSRAKPLQGGVLLDRHFQPGSREYSRASLSLAFSLVIENANTQMANSSLPQSRLGRPFWPLRRVVPSRREGVLDHPELGEPAHRRSGVDRVVLASIGRSRRRGSPRAPFDRCGPPRRCGVRRSFRVQRLSPSTCARGRSSSSSIPSTSATPAVWQRISPSWRPGSPGCDGGDGEA